MPEKLDDVLDIFAAFADAEGDVVLETDSGRFALTRGGETLSGRIAMEQGQLVVEESGDKISFRDFVVRRLARLDVLADRLLQRRPPQPGFIDGPADLESQLGTFSGTALGLLKQECAGEAAFVTRVTFVTADAGSGKTALLKQYQSQVASEFVARKSDFLFWHVDLQGRQLLRLSEALAGDLGELRVPGLWMAGIIRLIRMRALILAVDGFDELAAEQGSSDALGALASLVGELEGEGTIVAASRRAFFDSDEYLLRANVFKRAVDLPVQFNEIVLQPWRRPEALALIQAMRPGDDAPAEFYDEVVRRVGDSRHPIVTRPYLLTVLLAAGLTPSEIHGGLGGSIEDIVTGVVDAFVSREVTAKWLSTDGTNQPYLTQQQHFVFLSDVAEEMYRSQRDRLPVDIVTTLLTIRLEEWGVESLWRRQILNLAHQHALLQQVPGEPSARSFSHNVFREFFLAVALTPLWVAASAGEGRSRFSQFLTIGTLSSSVARFAASSMDRGVESRRSSSSALARVVRDEMRETYLRANAGTLLPALISDQLFEPVLLLDARLLFTGDAMTRTHFEGVHLKNSEFVSVDLSEVRWKSVVIEDSIISNLAIAAQSKFEDVRLVNCNLGGVRFRRDRDSQSGTESEVPEYAPDRVKAELARIGIRVVDSTEPEQVDDELTVVETPRRGEARRLVRAMGRTTTLTDREISQRFKASADWMLKSCVPLMVSMDMLEPTPWRGSGMGMAWKVKVRAEEILTAESAQSDARFADFWTGVDNLE